MVTAGGAPPTERTAETVWKRGFPFLLLAAVSLLFLAAPRGAPEARRRDRLLIATWNIRNLSDRSRDPAELERIANVLARFDLVAVQEVRDLRILRRLKARLPGWTYTVSQPVGRKRKEYYAFFYRTEKVSQVGPAWTLPDRYDRFEREPFCATFRSGAFDFTLCTVHVLYGKDAAERRREVGLLDDCVRAVQRANGAEDDVLLAGDFNFPPGDEGWEMAPWIPLIRPPAKTTIGDKSLYDNIWIHPGFTREYDGRAGVEAFDRVLYGGDLKRASLEVSDHRPVWAEFVTVRDDDPNDYGDLSTARLPPPEGKAGGRAEAEGSSPPPSGEGAVVVYVTKSGKKYHRKGCRCLRGDGTPLPLEEARARGLEPCKVCKPPE